MSTIIRSSRDDISPEKVQVVCRIRPSNQKENKDSCITLKDESIEYSLDGQRSKFEFDRVYGEESTQAHMFEGSARRLIADVITGYNATIFAYGQAGAGKVSFVQYEVLICFLMYS